MPYIYLEPRVQIPDILATERLVPTSIRNWKIRVYTNTCIGGVGIPTGMSMVLKWIRSPLYK